MLSRMLRFAILLAVVAAIVEAIRRMAQPEAATSTAVPRPWTPLEPTPGSGNGATAGASEQTSSAEVSPPEPQPVSRVEAPAPAEAPAEPSSNAAPAKWVDPDAEGACPASHPLKAKDSSKIVHQPGGLSYDRTHADRCYLDLDAAEADGYRAAKR
jgi:hypothetical protein